MMFIEKHELIFSCHGFYRGGVLCLIESLRYQ